METARTLAIIVAAMVVLVHCFIHYFRSRPVEPAGPFGARWRPLESLSITISSYAVGLIGAAIVTGLIYLVIFSVSPGTFSGESALERFISIFVFEAIGVGFVYLFLRRRKASAASWGFKRFRATDVAWAFMFFVAYFVAAWVATIVFPVNYEQQQQLGFSTYASGIDLVLIFVSLVVIPPVSEEFVFRGFLYSGLRSTWPRWAAVLVASTIFGIAHLEFGSGQPLHWAAALDTFVMSIFLVWAREKTGSLAAPILMHMIKNGIAFTALFIFHVV